MVHVYTLLTLRQMQIDLQKLLNIIAKILSIIHNYFDNLMISLILRVIFMLECRLYSTMAILCFHQIVDLSFKIFFNLMVTLAVFRCNEIEIWQNNIEQLKLYLYMDFYWNISLADPGFSGRRGTCIK